MFIRRINIYSVIKSISIENIKSFFIRFLNNLYLKRLFYKINNVLKKGLDYLKKPFPTLIFTLLFLFAYNLFLKSRYKMPYVEEDIVTTNIKYLGNNFEIIAKKNIDKAGKKIFYDLDLNSEKGYIKAGYSDMTNSKDIIFKEGVKGENEEWQFSSEEARYYDNKDSVFTLNGRVIANNKEKKLIIKADNLRATNNLNDFKLKGNILIEFEDIKLYCQSAIFDKSKNSLIAEDSAKVEIKQLIGGKEEIILLETTKIIYDIDSKKGESDRKFKITAKKNIIVGKSFEIDNKKFTTNNEIHIYNDERTTNLAADNCRYDKKLSLDNVNGKYEDNLIKADNFEAIEDKYILKGSVFAQNKEKQTIYCGILEVDSKIAVAKLDVKVIDGIYNISSHHMVYNIDEKKANINLSTIKYEDKVINSSDLEYFSDLKVGSMKNVKISTPDIKASMNNLNFELDNEKYTLIGNIIIDQDENIIISEKIDVERKNLFSNKLNINNKDYSLYLENVNYDLDKKSLQTDEEVLGLIEKKYDLKTKGLDYNMNSKTGRSYGKAIIEEADKDFKILSNSFDINDKQISLTNLKGNRDDLKFVSNKGTFDLERDSLLCEGSVEAYDDNMKIYSESIELEVKKNIFTFISETKILANKDLIICDNGSLDIDENIFKANNINFFRENGDIFRADRAELDRNMEIMIAEGNIVGELIEDEINFRSKSSRILFKDDKNESIFDEEKEFLTRAELIGNAEFYYKDLEIKANFIEYDNALGDKKLNLVYATENLLMSFKNNDSQIDVKSKYAFYEISKEIGKMKKDVTISYISKDGASVNAKCDQAYYSNLEQNVSMIGNVEANSSKSNLKLTSEDMNLDLKSGIITSDKKTSFSYDLDEKGKEEAVNIIKSASSDDETDDLDEFKSIIDNLKN
jgi:lipopolysaccharide export system protein LptA